jgi:hypothetical protein
LHCCLALGRRLGGEWGTPKKIEIRKIKLRRETLPILLEEAYLCPKGNLEPSSP